MQALQSFILGIIQGVTEWLPISSSGHLVIFQKLINIEVPVAFDVFLHLATLFVILIFFRQDLSRILKAFFMWQTKTNEFRLAICIILATIFTALVVLPLREIFEKTFSSLIVVACAFILTGFLLLFSERKEGEKEFNVKYAILIGLIQGIAFIPGISRSGSTIALALLLGIKREEAFKFSFLIAIPAILGASIIKFNELSLSGITPTSLAAGFISALIVGFFSLLLLRKIIIMRKFHYFAYYCFAIAITIFITQVFLK